MIGSCILALALVVGTPVAAGSGGEAGATAPTTRKLTGQALHPRTGQLLYNLVYEEQWNRGSWSKRIMRGYLPDGQEFMVRTLEATGVGHAPVLVMTNDLTDEYVEARPTSDGIMVVRGSRSAKEKKVIEAPASTIIPGGIVAAIRRDWKLLREGKTMEWKLVAPGMLDWVSVRARPQGVVKAGKRDALRVVLEADSWVVRLVAPRVIFDIDLETRALAHYVGMGALPDEDGDIQDIDLVFNGELPNVPPGLL